MKKEESEERPDRPEDGPVKLMSRGEASLLLECLRPYRLSSGVYKDLRGLMLAEPIEEQVSFVLM